MYGSLQLMTVIFGGLSLLSGGVSVQGPLAGRPVKIL